MATTPLAWISTLPMPPATPVRRALSTPEAARLLGKAEDTVRRAFDAGRLPGYRQPNGRRWLDAEYAEQLAKQLGAAHGL